MENTIFIPARNHQGLYKETSRQKSNMDKAWELTKGILNNLVTYSEVGYDKYQISNKPLVSFNYMGCRAIVLNGLDLCTLGHILPQEPHENFIDKMVSEMNLAPTSLMAVVLGGYNPKAISEYLTTIGIDVKGCFQDIDRKPLGYYPLDAKKDVIVKSREGLITLISKKGIKNISIQMPKNPFVD